MPQPDIQHESFDSEQQYLGKVYAKALLGAAEKTGDVEALLAELDSVVTDVLDKLPKFDAALASPRVPLNDRLAMLDRAFQSQMSVTLLNFLKVVARHGRFHCLRAIRRWAQQLRNDALGRVEVQVRTAAEISPALRETIAAQLTKSLGRDVVMQHVLDPALIGGLVVRVGDTVYDGSVANRLERLRKDTVEKTAAQIRASLERFTAAG